ncbi:MAG TPA: CAP domain-containing protein, partial [Blastocatellia bacterium]|nr:CAP domain-containing protein [Blastocatellia bacterium]
MRSRSLQALILLIVLSLLICFALPTPQQAQSSVPTLDSEEQAFVTLINDYRAQNGLAPLQVSIALTNAAKWMSQDMAQKNYFDHNDSLGRTPYQRMVAFGYNYNTW